MPDEIPNGWQALEQETRQLGMLAGGERSAEFTRKKAKTTSDAPDRYVDVNV
jgi:hypothetical protein